MADVMTPEQRSRCMAAIKGKDTKPEMIVRKYHFSRGMRFPCSGQKVAGTPDIVLPKYKTAIFVNGCFFARGMKDITVSRWHSNSILPSLNQLIQIAQILKVNAKK